MIQSIDCHESVQHIGTVLHQVLSAYGVDDATMIRDVVGVNVVTSQMVEPIVHGLSNRDGEHGGLTRLVPIRFNWPRFP
jgi:hypothetical protein